MLLDFFFVFFLFCVFVYSQSLTLSLSLSLLLNTHVLLCIIFLLHDTMFVIVSIHFIFIYSLATTSKYLLKLISIRGCWLLGVMHGIFHSTLFLTKYIHLCIHKMLKFFLSLSLSRTHTLDAISVENLDILFLFFCFSWYFYVLFVVAFILIGCKLSVCLQAIQVFVCVYSVYFCFKYLINEKKIKNSKYFRNHIANTCTCTHIHKIFACEFRYISRISLEITVCTASLLN